MQKRNYCFELITTEKDKSICLSSDTEEARDSWVEYLTTIQASIMKKHLKYSIEDSDSGYYDPTITTTPADSDFLFFSKC